MDETRLRRPAGLSDPAPWTFRGKPPRCPLSPPPPPHTHAIRRSAIRRLCEALALSYLAAPDARRHEKRALLYQLFTDWQDLLSEGLHREPLPEPYRVKMEHAEGLILARLEAPPDRDQLAAAVGMSADYLARLFRRHTGLSLRAFVRVQRMQKARRLLVAGRGNVSEVAYAMGYEDPLYFSRLFKKTFGVPPSELRSRYRIR